MTALLFPDEAARLRVGEQLVIVRPGDPCQWQNACAAGDPEVRCICVEPFVAPQDWVSLTGPCPTCGGSSTTCGCDAKWSTNPNHNRHCLLKRKCDCRDGRWIVPLCTECASPYCDGKGGDKDQPGWRCPNFCNKARVLVGRGNIEVDPEPDGRNWRIVIDCVEVAA